EECHVVHVEARQADRVLRVAALVLDLDVLLRLQEQAKPGAHERVVVDDEDADHGRGTSATSVVPAPGLVSTVSRPPSSSTRSRMPTSPSPWSRVRVGSKPAPSSSTTADTAAGFPP